MGSFIDKLRRRATCIIPEDNCMDSDLMPPQVNEQGVVPNPSYERKESPLVNPQVDPFNNFQKKQPMSTMDMKQNEYAKQGKTVALIRICVNNLAGVPSIVFGVFGLGFFIYGIGGSIDTLFYQDNLPSPTYGTGGILWASLTLALLTVPVVIVATEESLNAVSKGIRDGSLALGATKWETLRNIIIPTSLPGILTGLILAISRATGEVAPLMITGVVKLAPSMPLDGYFPYLHLERKFMHLGFHIYDVGFQSPNSEAALPMVFSTALLLILIVIVLNSSAILIRNRLKLKHKG